MTTVQAEASSGGRHLSVLFRATDARYSLRATDVVKVVDIHRVNRLPRLPTCTLGISQHRGRIITIFDLMGLLFPDRAEVRRVAARDAITRSGGSAAQAILLDRGQRNIALLVDRIEEITLLKVDGGRQSGTSGLTVVRHRGLPVGVLNADALHAAVLALGGEGENRAQ